MSAKNGYLMRITDPPERQEPRREQVVERLEDITEADIMDGYESGDVFVLSPTSPDQALFVRHVAESSDNR